MNCRKPRRGVILPMIAILSVFLICIVVFFVDVAYMHLARTQLQVATDAAAKAGAEALDAGLTEDEVRQIAIDIAALNEVAGEPLTLELSDVELGNSALGGDGSWAYTASAQPYNSVRVVGEKTDDSPSGSVPLFFAGAVGVDTFSPTRNATACQVKQEVMLLCDRSHSMCYDNSGTNGVYPEASDGGYCSPPVAGSRWSALYNGVSSFLSICEETSTNQQQRVGLITWAHEYNGCSGTFPSARLEMPLGFQFDAMNSIMVNIGSGGMPGGTNMAAGLDMGINELIGPNSDSYAKKTIILFTDGEWNQGDDPTTRIATAQSNNITIHVISFLDAVDTEDLNAIASQTGGVHYQASTPQELLDAFNGLARSLPVVLTK